MPLGGELLNGSKLIRREPNVEHATGLIRTLDGGVIGIRLRIGRLLLDPSSIRTGSTRRCPQNFLLAIYDGGTPPAASSLPTTGCFYASRSTAPVVPLG